MSNAFGKSLTRSWRPTTNPEFPPFLNRHKRLPSLDGWRCLSIVLVLLSHSSRTSGYPENWSTFLRWIPNGGFGVNVFFVISGFLITYLLIKEQSRSRTISLKGFYIRRAYRILPAYIVFLLALLAISLSTEISLNINSWAHLFTYTVNYGSVPWIGAHIWSLSVEEQFYFLWPAAFLFLYSKRLAVLSLCAFALIVTNPPLQILSYLDIGGALLKGYSFLIQGQYIAWGCLLALACAHFGKHVSQVVTRRPRVLSSIAIALIVGHIVLTRLFLLGPVTVAFGSIADAVGITLLLLVSIAHFDRGPWKYFQLKPVVQVGVWSYSIYLWQQIFCTPMEHFGFATAPWWNTFPLWIIAAFAAGIASYYLVEKPFLDIKDGRHPTWPITSFARKLFQRRSSENVHVEKRR